MRKLISVVLVVVSLILAGCQTSGTIQPLPSQVVPSPIIQVATPTITPVPPRSLSICLGQEPTSLYMYASSSRTTWSVLEAVYDGPIDINHYSPRPVILQGLPSSSNGTARLQPAEVKAGQEVVDANGYLAVLEKGLRVFPAGCQSSDCAVAWDGQSALQMDQQLLRFQLLPGITWSDGQPLKAADSVFSFQVASDPATPVNHWLVDRTASYTAADELTVEWVGIPGYLPAKYESLYFTPLPQHILAGYSADALLLDEEVNRRPLGWGAYVIEDWVAGDHISLKKNSRYYRTGEGLPVFDKLVFRFLGEQTDNNLNALVNGECDVVDLTTFKDEEVANILQMNYEGKMQVYFTQGPEWEHLDFGIKPASYDDGYNTATDRPDFFSDVRVRQAVQACLDREGLISTYLFSRSLVPNGMYPPDSPYYPAEIQAVKFDPTEGARLLAEVGWVDTDADSATPRTAQSVAGVPDGTPFSITYQTTDSPLRQKAAAWLAASLGQCGIQVQVETGISGELFAGGPEGDIFGRKFDLVQFTWVGGTQSPCYLYETNQIPAAGNLWIGANVTGFSNEEFDAACRSLRETRPEETELLKTRSAEVSRLFAEQIPVIPLYYSIKITAARLDMCGVQVDGSARSNLWNLESYNYGGGCK